MSPANAASSAVTRMALPPVLLVARLASAIDQNASSGKLSGKLNGAPGVGRAPMMQYGSLASRHSSSRCPVCPCTTAGSRWSRRSGRPSSGRRCGRRGPGVCRRRCRGGAGAGADEHRQQRSCGEARGDRRPTLAARSCRAGLRSGRSCPRRSSPVNVHAFLSLPSIRRWWWWCRWAAVVPSARRQRMCVVARSPKIAQ